MAGTDQCIGKLTLDITDVKSKIAEVNAELQKIGVTKVNSLSAKVANEVKKQLADIENAMKASVKSIQDAAKQAVDAFGNIGSGKSGVGSLVSEMVKLTDQTKTLGRTVDANGNTVSKIISNTNTGLDATGRKIKEVYDGQGNLVRRVVDTQSAYKSALNILEQYFKKSAQLYEMEQAGKDDTPRYAQLKAEVAELDQQWKNLDQSVQLHVQSMQEAKVAAQTYGEVIAAINTSVDNSAMEKALQGQIDLYKQYYDYMSKAANFGARGDTANQNMYETLAQGVKGYIDSIAALEPELDRQARAQEEVTNAQIKYNESVNSAANKARQQALKDDEKAVNDYKVALLDLLKAQTDFNNKVASGQLVAGTQKYQEAENHLNNLETAAIRAGQGIDKAGRQAAEGTREVQIAMDNLKISEAAIGDSQVVSDIDRVKQAYEELRNAISRYASAKKTGDEAGMANYQAQINAQMQLVNSIEAAVKASNMDAAAKQEIYNWINKCRAAQEQHNASINTGAQQTSEMGNQLSSLLTRYFSIMAAIRTIKSLIQNTVEYVSEYYDKMNEVRIITGATEAEAEKLGDTYRDLAKSMSVSSLDMADAAIYFTRQGLGAAEIEERLKHTTQYAKAANIEFERSAELITSVVNSMDLVEEQAEDGRNAAQRVADVFLAIGDRAATSGEEIGTAMQKASAAAGAFGVEFEWLAASIATVSETTRQEASSIGTAFNTLIARLHNIRTAGYNAEDETKINDIQKALAHLNISLLDQEGNWRKMEDIFSEIAAQWDGLDGKTRSYIATTMAGVKQQNVFLALMEDMAKATEGASRQQELYNIAIDSAGTASQKYAIYTESVTAAQERLTVAQEEFYSMLNAGVIKDWYNGLAGYVNIINKGTDAWKGWNIVIPLVIGGLTALILVLKNVAGITTALMAHPVILTIAGITAGIVGLTTVLSGLASTSEKAKGKIDEANKALSESSTRMSSLNGAQTKINKMFEEIGDGAKLSKEEIEKYSTTLESIAEISPIAKQVVEDFKNGLIDQKEAAKQLNEEMERLTENERNYSRAQLFKKYSNWKPSNEANDSLISDMATWEESKLAQYATDEASRFARNLGNAYANNLKMPKEVKERIDELLDSFREIEKSESVTYDEQWGYIGQIIWSEFVGSDSYSLEDALVQKAQDTINEVTAAMTAGMDADMARAYRKKLTAAIFGEDGIFTEEDYQQMGVNVAKFLIDGFEMTDIDIAESIGDKLFSGGTEGLFEDMGTQFAKSFIDQYHQALAAGLSDKEITELFKQSGLPTMELDNLGKILAEQLRESIKANFGVDSFLTEIEDVDTGITEYIDGWENLDLSTLKTINTLSQAGVEFQEINALVLASGGDVNVLKKSLQELADTLGITTDAEEETEVSIADLAKQAQAAIKDIQALDVAIKDVQDGKIDSYSNLLGLAESHPEIWTAIGDTEKLLEVLKQVKAESEKNQRENIKSIILGSEGAQAGTKYAEMTGTLQSIRDSLTDPDEIKEFDEWIDKLVDNWMKVNENEKEAAKEAKTAAKSMAEAMKEAQQEFNNSVKEVETLDKTIKNLTDKKKIDFSDIINLSTAHPEIVAFADDAEKLLEILNKIRDQEKNDVRASIRKIMLKSEDYFKNSGYYDPRYKNMEEYLNALEASGGDWRTVSDAVDQAAQNIVDASKDSEEAAETWLEAQTKIAKINSEVNWAKNNNFAEQIGELQRAYENGGGAAALNVWKEYDEEMRKAIASEYPDIIMALAEVEEKVNNTNKAHDEQIEKIRTEQEELFKLSNVDLNSRPVIDSRKLGEAGWDGEFQEGDLSTVYSTSYHAGTKEGADMAWNKDVVVTLTPILENGEVMSPEAVEKYLEELFAQSGDISELMANDKAGKGILIDVTAVEDAQSFEEAQEAVNKLMIRLHELQERLYGAKVESADLGTALNNGAKYASFSSTAFEKTGKAIKQLRDGTISATDAYDTFTSEVNNVTKAYEEILAYQEKLAYNQSLTAEQIAEGKEKALQASDVDTLAKLIGKTTDEVLADFPAAVAAFDELTSATGELTMMLDELNKAAFIRITGTSEADFSNIQNGLIATQGMAEETIKMLEATGQWTTETVKLDQYAWVKEGDGWVQKYLQGTQQILKPTGNNPFARKSSTKQQTNTSNDTKGRKGGGGGGSSDKNQNFRDKNTNTEVERMLEMMSQVNAIQQSQQNYYQSQQKYYSQTGQLQGVISYMKQESEVLKDQNKTLEDNIKQIERYMAEKRAEIATLDTSDEAYADVADDLDKLQKAHQTYTKQLIDNKTAIDALNKSILEQQKKIRQMEIDLRNLILSAIEDREKKKTDMLNAEIKLENEIFNLIKKRYETERDEILETNQMKIDALQREKDLLSEQLQLRKEQAEAEDKQAKLREMEVKYQRMLADPTRRKEAANLKTEIDEMRKEMAWDLAENEVKAQQDSIDQQITSLEDYAEYVTNYYEDLFEHPQKLLEEMRNIMTLTYNEIIEWLKANDEEYKNASENTQLTMVNGWTETYNEMKGILQDYWEEVEYIITQGDDYIIEFLKNNSSEYAKAGKLQAEAYVDEWMEQLDNLHKAYQSVTAEVAADYDTIRENTYQASSKSSGGGSGSKGSGKGNTSTAETDTATTQQEHGFSLLFNGKTFSGRGVQYASAEEARQRGLYYIQQEKNKMLKNGVTSTAVENIARAALGTLTYYKEGGIADFTGPAWLDGSKERPERILNPYQNQLFETLVESLERMSKVQVSLPPSMADVQTSGGNSQVSVGDIIVNVENLDTEDDYEELAEKVGEKLMERIGKTAAIGGLRIRSN